jgi:hypothetical protein
LPPIPIRRGPIENDFLIVGEGDGDSAFFNYLNADRNLTGFQCEHAGGNTGFEDYFKALVGRKGYHRLRGLIAVGDNDQTPDDSFKEIRKQLKNAKLPPPDTPQTIVKRNGAPAVAILMLPLPVNGGSSHGCLETVLLEAAIAHNPVISACVLTYCTCTGANAWPKSAADKLKLRALLSAASPSDPNIGLQYALKPTKNLIPMNHAAFTSIADFIATFPAAVG